MSIDHFYVPRAVLNISYKVYPFNPHNDALQ